MREVEKYTQIHLKWLWFCGCQNFMFTLFVLHCIAFGAVLFGAFLNCALSSSLSLARSLVVCVLGVSVFGIYTILFHAISLRFFRHSFRFMCTLQLANAVCSRIKSFFTIRRVCAFLPICLIHSCSLVRFVSAASSLRPSKMC